VPHFVNQHCHSWGPSHTSWDVYAKQDADDHTMIACLMAWASNMGLGRMGKLRLSAITHCPRRRITVSVWKRSKAQ